MFVVLCTGMCVLHHILHIYIFMINHIHTMVMVYTYYFTHTIYINIHYRVYIVHVYYIHIYTYVHITCTYVHMISCVYDVKLQICHTVRRYHRTYFLIFNLYNMCAHVYLKI